jgi:hypothetical protein
MGRLMPITSQKAAMQQQQRGFSRMVRPSGTRLAPSTRVEEELHAIYEYPHPFFSDLEPNPCVRYL